MTLRFLDCFLVALVAITAPIWGPIIVLIVLCQHAFQIAKTYWDKWRENPPPARCICQSCGLGFDVPPGDFHVVRLAAGLRVVCADCWSRLHGKE